ncbi:methyltransferase type 11 [bacterium]|nr:MAG: methyltransferase type 11 [bacterium]
MDNAEQNIPPEKARPPGLNGAKTKAEEIARDAKRTSRLVEEAYIKAEKQRGVLEKIWDDLNGLLRLVKAWTKGDYKSVPWQTIVLAVAAIIYFINPFDVIPDFFPVMGYIDDAAVLGFVIASIKGDIDKFLSWEFEKFRGRSPDSEALPETTEPGNSERESDSSD